MASDNIRMFAMKIFHFYMNLTYKYLSKKSVEGNHGKVSETQIRQSQLNMEESNALLKEMKQIMGSGHGKFNY